MHYIQSLPIFFILLSIILYSPMKVILVKRNKKTISIRKEFIYILIIAYTESLLYWTVFPDFSGEPRDWLGVNLIPFSTIGNYLFLFSNGYMHTAVINLLGNIVVFFPIGIFIFLLKKDGNIKTTILIGFFSSLFIEVTQLTFSYLHILSRSFDIDDLILNTFGVTLGYLLARAAQYLFQLKNPPSK